MNKDSGNIKYLKLLKQNYSTSQSVIREIINLSAIINLPKGTEFFLSDIHGEYEAFLHIMNNCSGVIKEKVDLIFKDVLSEFDRQELCTLIYYPREKMTILSETGRIDDDWYTMTLNYLIQLAKLLSSKYTRSKVRKALPEDYAYIIDELLHAQKNEDTNKVSYHRHILQTIIDLDDADEFIIALSALIKRLAVDHLHIVGDIFDRGGSADKIIDLLMNYHSLDIEWGNHDILWMGAACGNDACICNVIRNNLKYGNVEILENAYGISLRPLMLFGMSKYGIKDGIQAALAAIKVILFKLEGQLIKSHPEYGMDDRLLLEHINPTDGTVTIEGKEIPLKTNVFPTLDVNNPYELSDEENEIVLKLHRSFVSGQRLNKHIKFLYDKGSMYNVYNRNLIFHGCVPVDDNGIFDMLFINGKYYHGKALLDICEEKARAAYIDNPNTDDVDFMWFLWGGEKSPLCGRVVKTFERDYIENKNFWKEKSNPYYSKYYDESFCSQILHEFGLYDVHSHIINGHTPVHAVDGENPVRANEKLFVIDGGFCRSMNKTTGIAGYTLIFNSHGLRLKAHTPFTSVEDALMNNTDIESESEIIEKDVYRMFVRDTDIGKKLQEDIADLKKLLDNYRKL
ncbi:fructose-1,6-bisphosphatase [Lachnoanaerobaculum umeaense]|jgi:fructose-1,6-bisphosphatase class 3 2|uniref:Fructose-1,6-bisphosphatase class 3 n=1 Tax=Lachnoanaerobaculum umeaense TaxID=617123 RepID=A0A385PZS5_9FIRM|nr:fructose-1,6-bisphosphatase [Lachnoanaerobaculum umeaense]AYA99436.1 fructose-1,6-bisphosphatase [Lachnoanaerobaculum umeaense]PZW99538.1 fructose-1,6-bisphosphatase-3 [Lachnoanaerobaculum umeaense]